MCEDTMKVCDKWTPVCATNEIPARGARVIRRAGLDDIAVFRSGQGAVYAIVDKCPHKGGPLSAGLVHGASVTCPLHGMVIDLPTGQVLAPDEGCVRTIAVKIDQDRVCLDLGEGQ